MKLWGGRFTGRLDVQAEEFLASIAFDQQLFEEDIAGSIAHCRMLAKQHIITKEDMEAIVAGLEAIRTNIRTGTFQFRVDREDIHLNIEAELRDRIGAVAGKLHTARSRNDQIALDLRMYIKRVIRDVQDDLVAVVGALVGVAERNAATIMPGYTHAQRAQPILFAHHMLAYVEMFRRDIDRLDDAYRRANVMPLGSGALAGTTFPIDRAWVASELGFAALSRNSLDAVGDRDFIVEFVSDCSLIMTHTSRLAEEFVWWSSAEFGFVQLSDAYATGSSMMPQKKNPDSAELIRGKTGRVFGHLIGLLSVLKGIPLAYDKDLQEDKEPLFDTVATVRGCLAVLRGVLDTLVVRSQTMREATRGGYLTATDLADYLVRKGLPFRDAHEVVGRLVAYCDEHKRDVEDLTFEEYQRFSPLFEANVAEVVTVDASVAARDIPGGTAPNRVRDALEEAKSYIEARSRERR